MSDYANRKESPLGRPGEALKRSDIPLGINTPFWGGVEKAINQADSTPVWYYISKLPKRLKESGRPLRFRLT
jgi:hypothetical protein